MARKHIFEDQVFRLPQFGKGTTVTIHYDPDNPPPFAMPSAGVVIVGEHECAPPIFQPMPSVVPGSFGPVREVPRGGNIGFDEGDPEYLALKSNLGKVQAKPPGFSPKVITSEDLLREAGMAVSPDQLLAEAGSRGASADNDESMDEQLQRILGEG